MNIARLADHVASLQAVLSSRERDRGTTQAEDGTPRFRHEDWHALVTRFATPVGVDYVGFKRVRRLLEEYLSRLSFAQPQQLVRVDDRLAFYINAYNAIAVHQILRHYPVTSLLDVPHAFARPYAIGRELLSLNTLLHTKIRGFGDPRVHAAVVPASISAPPLRAYSGEQLQAELDQQMRVLLADPVRGARKEDSITLISAIVRRFAGDFAAGTGMPSLRMLAIGYFRPTLAIPFLRPYLPPELIATLNDDNVRWMRYNWGLNTNSRSAR